MHEFLDDGLTNVFLLNGFTVHETRHGRGVGIAHVAQLTSGICVALALRLGKLRGVEFRYIRRAMELTQANIAKLFGRTEQTIANWEKRNQVPLEASHLLKELALKKFGYERLVSCVLDQLGHDKHGGTRIIMSFDSVLESWHSNLHPQIPAASSVNTRITFNKRFVDKVTENSLTGQSSFFTIVTVDRELKAAGWVDIDQPEFPILDLGPISMDSPFFHRPSHLSTPKKHRVSTKVGR